MVTHEGAVPGRQGDGRTGDAPRAAEDRATTNGANPRSSRTLRDLVLFWLLAMLYAVLLIVLASLHRWDVAAAPPADEPEEVGTSEFERPADGAGVPGSATLRGASTQPRPADPEGRRPDLKITVFDAVAPPGTEISVTVKVEQDGPGFINPDRRGFALLLTLEGDGEPRTLQGTTARDGLAHVRLRTPDQPGSYTLSARPATEGPSQRKAAVPAQVFVIPADRSVIICDLDGTVTVGEGIDVASAEPQVGAAAALVDLARRHALIYLTARDEGLLDRSRAWLEKHGFPRAPVLGRDWTWIHGLRTGSYKTRAISALQLSFPGLRRGIGNSRGDRIAYGECRLTHVLIDSEAGVEEFAPGLFRHRTADWPRVPALLESPAYAPGPEPTPDREGATSRPASQVEGSRR